jgi:hypothetical protein
MMTNAEHHPPQVMWKVCELKKPGLRDWQGHDTNGINVLHLWCGPGKDGAGHISILIDELDAAGSEGAASFVTWSMAGQSALAFARGVGANSVAEFVNRSGDILSLLPGSGIIVQQRRGKWRGRPSKLTRPKVFDLSSERAEIAARMLELLTVA